ncbi:MAG: hypothetical protein AABY07_07180 [Nanoarchaeota archaeon]
MNRFQVNTQNIISVADSAISRNLLSRLDDILISDEIIEAKLDNADVGKILRLTVNPGYDLRIPSDAKVLDEDRKNRVVFKYQGTIYDIKIRN